MQTDACITISLTATDSHYCNAILNLFFLLLITVHGQCLFYILFGSYRNEFYVFNNFLFSFMTEDFLAVIMKQFIVVLSDNTK